MTKPLQVGVVTAFVPLPVKHLTATQYHDYGASLRAATKEAGAQWCFFSDDYDDMWLSAENPPMVPANPVPEDRYAGPLENAMSNVVQHNRTAWALRAAEKHPEIDVWVWLDYGIMKQGAWRNNQLTEASVTKFLKKVATTCPPTMNFIPFPGISEPVTVYPTGNVWRFCGSTHIWPKQLLPAIDEAYRHELRKWIQSHHTTPLDLPIWALVEKNSGLPFRWYGAEYDASQLDNYPYGAKDDNSL
jgi:hypothetical protein